MLGSSSEGRSEKEYAGRSAQNQEDRRWRCGEVGTLVSAIEHLSVGQLRWRQSGRDGVAGDGQRRVQVAGRHGGQRVEHGAELVRRSLLWRER